MPTLLALLALSACAGKSSIALDDTDTDTDVPDTDTDTGEPDTDDNTAPSGLEITLEPTHPPPGASFAVVIVAPATDPDGDEVSYRYRWIVDGASYPLEEATVPDNTTSLDERWEVVVVPSDGTEEGPATSASLTIGNEPPSAPGLTFSPSSPMEDDDIVLVIDPAPVDPEGDPLVTTITWYQNDAEVSWFADLTVIDKSYVAYNDTFRAVVSVSDPYHDPVVTEATVSVLYSCDHLPTYNLDDTTLSDATAYHGLAFDDDGTLIGYDARSALVKSRYDGTSAVFMPRVGGIQQMDRLPDGDFVLGDSTNRSLTRVTSAGASSVIATDVGYVYGVTVGPDGMVWTADGGIRRTDPSTGETTTILPQPTAWTAHSLNFNLDSTRIYIGTIGRGDLYYMDLDANLDPTTEPLLFASGVGNGWHDGIAVDECGNLYVADYSSSGLYRVELDATVTPMVRANSSAYGHGAMWGNGVDGWRDDAIYQPQPYNGNTVREVVIGLGNGDAVRTWNGVSAPW